MVLAAAITASTCESTSKWMPMRLRRPRCQRSPATANSTRRKRSKLSSTSASTLRSSTRPTPDVCTGVLRRCDSCRLDATLSRLYGPSPGDQQRNQPDHQEYKEANLRKPYGSTGDSAEAKNARDD